MANPLVSDREVEFVLYEVLDVERLCALPHFEDHSRDTFDLVLASARRLARDVLYPAYKPMDEAPPVFEDGGVRVHPRMKDIFPQLVELGLVNPTRPYDVGGQQLPVAVATTANAYVMAANLSAYGYVGLTTGAAHLIEAFGSDELKRDFMAPMYDGVWTGTMALTEPQAGSSLSDVQTTATPAEDGTYRIRGSKIFISGGDHDLTDNIVHMTLARIDGAPAGTKGISLFAVPKRRREGDALVDNDVSTAGVIHKIGWKGLPSLAINYGEGGDCRGWLVGEANRGLAYMFQTMNEARIMVGINGVATASVAYHEALEYARTRPQGRPITAKDPTTPQVPIIEHADVRRMLLRQKAIVEGGLSLVATAGMYADLAEHAVEEAERAEAQLMLDLLTPIAKSFPAEKGFEANALAVQVHGGYGYSSEYLPESWLRDQKLNTIHEGTTGIQAMDLLGRRIIAGGGAALAALGNEVARTIQRAAEAGCDEGWCNKLEGAAHLIGGLTAELAGRGQTDGAEAMMLHATDFLDLVSTTCVAWQWLEMAAAAHEALASGAGDREGFYRGKLVAAQYWFTTELPRITHLAELCRSGEDSYGALEPDWL